MLKPKILYILHCYFNTAGTEEHTRLLSRHLADTFDCYIAAPNPNSPQGPSVSLLHQGKIIKEFAVAPIAWPIAAMESPLHSKALKEIVKEIQPSLIHIQHTMNWHVGVIDDLLSFGIPTVMSFHDYFHITPHYTMQGIDNPKVTLGPNYSKLYFGQDITEYLKKRRAGLTRALESISTKITPSKYLGQILTEIFPSDYRVIPHGIEPFMAEQPQADGVVFGYIGSLLPQKGYAVLLDAFQQIVIERKDAELHMFGGGMDAHLPAVKGVTYHGNYRWEDLPGILSKFTIGIIPSVFAETFCLTLSELWMGGKAVIASEIGALHERIKDDVNGKLFTAGNVESLYKTMNRCFETSVWKRWKGEQVRTAANMAEEYKALYLKKIS